MMQKETGEDFSQWLTRVKAEATYINDLYLKFDDKYKKCFEEHGVTIIAESDVWTRLIGGLNPATKSLLGESLLNDLTYNKDNYRDLRKYGIEVVTPKEFLKDTGELK